MIPNYLEIAAPPKVKNGEVLIGGSFLKRSGNREGVRLIASIQEMKRRFGHNRRPFFKRTMILWSNNSLKIVH